MATVSMFSARSAWRSHVKKLKTKASKAPVPVISQLAARLDAHLKTMGSPTSGFMFPNAVGKPIGMQRVVDDVIRPSLKGSGIEWHGWHALRRGLATNLHDLGVPDKITQMILRHSNVAVTQSCYIKTVDSQAVEAMRKLECATTVQLAKTQREAAPDVLLPRVM